MYEEEIVKYLLKECHGLHPFYISRIVALLDIKYLEETGRKLTDFDYHRMPYGFYSEKIPAILNSLDVEKVQSEKGNYVKLRNEDIEVNLPEDVKRRIDDILDEVCDLSDDELNRMIVESPYYEKL